MMRGLIALACLVASQTAAEGLDEVSAPPDTSTAVERLIARAGFSNIEKSFALIIGISDFEDYSDLPTEDDAIRMRDYLVEEADFDYVHVLTGDKVTKQRLEEILLDELRPLIGPNDRFLFYWSGHGETQEIGGVDRGFLPLADSKRDRLSSMVAMTDLRRWNAFISANHVLYLLDSCFSGLVGAVPLSGLEDIARAQLSGPARHIITAGRGNEQTIAIDALGGSVFTHALLKGLRGSADARSALGSDGLVSVGELKEYVSLEVARLREDFGWGKSITPQIRDISGSDGAFFFPLPAVFRVEDPPESTRPPSGDAIIKEVQEVLTTLGYDAGDADGVIGLRTRAAILRFQGDYGLDQTGEINEQTLSAFSRALAGLIQPMGRGEDLPIFSDQPIAAATFKPCENCPELVRAGGGQVQIGGLDPYPPVDVDPFMIATTETTIGQFRHYMEETGLAIVDAKSESDEPSCYDWQPGDKLRKTLPAYMAGITKPDNHPIACVSREDVEGYLDWLNEDNPGPHYRLPTEAEVQLLLDPLETWRRAEESFFWANDAATLCKIGNFGDASTQFSWRNSACRDGYTGVAPVASFPADGNGVHDLSGNLWELVGDCWRANLSLPNTFEGCGSAMLKGGSFDDPVKNTTPETRQPVPMKRRQSNIGFRIARDIE